MKPERVQKIYDELSEYVVELAPDPGARGPGYLQDLISKTRGFLNQVSRFVQEVHRARHALESELDALTASYELTSDNLLANDGRVTRLPNIDDRKAMIGFLLIEDRTKILGLQRQLKELGFVEKAVKHTQKELDNTMSAIRMQKSLLDTEMRTGAFYGDENDVSRRSTLGLRAGVAAASGFGAEDIDAEEFARLIAASEVPAAPEMTVEEEDLTTLLGDTKEAAAPAPVVESTPEKTPQETAQQVVVTPERAANVEVADTRSDEQKMHDFLEDDEFSGVFDDLDESSV